MGPLTYPGQGHLCFMDSGVSVLLYNKHYEPGGLSDGGGFLTKASTAHTRTPQHRHGHTQMAVCFLLTPSACPQKELLWSPERN